MLRATTQSRRSHDAITAEPRRNHGGATARATLPRASNSTPHAPSQALRTETRRRHRSSTPHTRALQETGLRGSQCVGSQCAAGRRACICLQCSPRAHVHNRVHIHACIHVHILAHISPGMRSLVHREIEQKDWMASVWTAIVHCRCRCVNQHMRRAQLPHSAASIRPTSERAIRGDHVANSPLDWAHPNPGLAHTTLGWLHAPTMGRRHAANHRLHGVARSSRATEAQDSPIRRELCVYSAAWAGRCRRHHRQHASTPCVWQPHARARCIRPLQTESRSRSVQIASKAA